MKENKSLKKDDECIFKDKGSKRVTIIFRLTIGLLMFGGSLMVGLGLHNIWIGLGMSAIAFGVLFI